MKTLRFSNLQKWVTISRLKARIPTVITLRKYEMGEYLKEQSTDHYSGTMEDVMKQIRERTGVERGYHIVPKSREHLLQYHPKPEELPPRSMKDSYSTATVPLSADELIRERYVTHLGRVRLGRLMEDMDMIAVWLCHRHVKLPGLPNDVFLPYTFVTLLVDRVDFFNTHLLVDKDIELSGFVSWTGRSSMQITIYVRQMLEDDFLNITKAVFLMVARNANNTGPAPVNTIKPHDEKEQEYWKLSAEQHAQRSRIGQESVFNSPPLEYEHAIIYDLLKRTTPKDSFELNKRVLPSSSNWMADSHRSSIIKLFPQNRNAQNTIFGGYLMRMAVELSFVMAGIYVKSPVRLKCISDISFLKPVQVTDVLEINTHVVYTSSNYLQLMTIAQTFNVSDGKNTTTNIFYLTFKAETVVDEVLPGSYREMLWYIHGRRKFLTALNLLIDYPLPPSEDKQTTEIPVK